MPNSRARKKILLTGGTGYLGIHIAICLFIQGYDIIIIDNLVNSHKSILNSFSRVFSYKPIFYRGNIKDKKILTKIFSEHKIDCVIHLAALKSVEDSFKVPIEYYNNNVSGSINLLETMNSFGVKKIIFSSSAAIYGDSKNLPISEKQSPSPISPYAKTKLIVEQIISEICAADSCWSAISLRYFNPIGSYDSRVFYENSRNMSKNLMNNIIAVATGRIKKLIVFGNNHPTKDGSCVRDFIHILDIAEGHICALKHVFGNNGHEAINLGTGNGTSVFNLINIYEKVNNLKIPKKISKNRIGDISILYADVTKAYRLLGWKAKRSLEEMCKSSIGRIN